MAGCRVFRSRQHDAEDGNYRSRAAPASLYVIDASRARYQARTADGRDERLVSAPRAHSRDAFEAAAISSLFRRDGLSGKARSFDMRLYRMPTMGLPASSFGQPRRYDIISAQYARQMVEVSTHAADGFHLSKSSCRPPRVVKSECRLSPVAAAFGNRSHIYKLAAKLISPGSATHLASYRFRHTRTFSWHFSQCLRMPCQAREGFRRDAATMPPA